jgi:hypothetical protein
VADIILVEHRGKAWLVRGERYIDDLLINSLPQGISIDIITCESESDVNEIWRREGYSTQDRSPWMIHPGIMQRIRRARAGQSIVFGQWSALLDDDALAVLHAAAVAAQEATDVEVFLISYIHPGQAQTMTDLTNLRCNLAEAELTRLGVAGSRIVREARSAQAGGTTGTMVERLDIRVGAE